MWVTLIHTSLHLYIIWYQFLACTHRDQKFRRTLPCVFSQHRVFEQLTSYSVLSYAFFFVLHVRKLVFYKVQSQQVKLRSTLHVSGSSNQWANVTKNQCMACVCDLVSRSSQILNHWHIDANIVTMYAPRYSQNVQKTQTKINFTTLHFHRCTKGCNPFNRHTIQWKLPL